MMTMAMHTVCSAQLTKGTSACMPPCMLPSYRYPVHLSISILHSDIFQQYLFWHLAFHAHMVREIKLYIMVKFQGTAFPFSCYVITNGESILHNNQRFLATQFLIYMQEQWCFRTVSKLAGMQELSCISCKSNQKNVGACRGKTWRIHASVRLNFEIAKDIYRQNNFWPTCIRIFGVILGYGLQHQIFRNFEFPIAIVFYTKQTPVAWSIFHCRLKGIFWRSVRVPNKKLLSAISK
jgi:hypothetical protein